MTYAECLSAVQACQLDILGAFHLTSEDGAPTDTGTLVLLGALEPGFWQYVSEAPEFADGRGDPLDRWSERVVTALADALHARPLFPFDGPPYQPFRRWALRSGRAWVSPVGLLVHDTAGLLVSYRGALALRDRLEIPPTSSRPCDDCPEAPCLAACPVAALTGAGYDLETCHRHLDAAAGRDCMDLGCAVRHACPVSKKHPRHPAQSAHHMRAFHP